MSQENIIGKLFQVAKRNSLPENSQILRNENGLFMDK